MNIAFFLWKRQTDPTNELLTGFAKLADDINNIVLIRKAWAFDGLKNVW